MENTTFEIIKSSVEGYHEVIVTYQEKGKNKQNFIFVKDATGLTKKDILEIAQSQFNQSLQKRKNKFSFVKFLSKHKTAIITCASIVLVAGVVTGIALGVANNIPTKEVEDDFDKMREAYKNYLIRTTSLSSYGDLSANEIMTHIVIGTDSTTKQPIYSKLVEKTISNVKTYFIKDLDYEWGSDRDSWPASTHLSQALNIAITAEVRHDKAIKDIALKMTYYWVFNNYRNTNWWQNELGADNNLASLGLFVFNDLNPKGQAALLGKVAEASFYYRPSLKTHTGANLFDYADITLKSSILSKNTTEFNEAIDRVEEEITDKHLEGFQTDGSFFQHGQQVQIGSYGKGVIRLGKVLRTMAESSRVFKDEKMEIIENYILRGLRSMTHKGYTNYSAVSREIARDNNLDAKSSFKDFNVYLELDSFNRKNELQKFLDDLADHQSTFDGMVYFDKAKMVAINVNDVYMSFKGTAPYLTNTECVNDENQLGLNLSYGTNTCVMDNGDDYYNIMPVWDFAFIPGTTSIQTTSSGRLPLANDTGFDENHDKQDQNILKMRSVYEDELYEHQLPEPGADNDYVYSSGMTEADPDPEKHQEDVVVLMQRSNHHEENDFTVTCVATPSGMALLGADLSYSGSVTEAIKEQKIVCYNQNSRKLHTTIEQAFTTGNETLSSDNKTFTRGKVAYQMLDDHEIVKVDRDITYGYWARNRALNAKEEKEGKVEYVEDRTKTTTAYIDYGTNRTGNKYAYSIQPKDIDKHFTLVHNFDDNKVQELTIPDGRTVVVFYQDRNTDYITESGKTISAPIKKGEYFVR